MYMVLGLVIALMDHTRVGLGRTRCLRRMGSEMFALHGHILIHQTYDTVHGINCHLRVGGIEHGRAIHMVTGQEDPTQIGGT